MVRIASDFPASRTILEVIRSQVEAASTRYSRNGSLRFPYIFHHEEWISPFSRANYSRSVEIYLRVDYNDGRPIPESKFTSLQQGFLHRFGTSTRNRML
jgi:hypothetical protein